MLHIYEAEWNRGLNFRVLRIFRMLAFGFRFLLLGSSGAAFVMTFLWLSFFGSFMDKSLCIVFVFPVSEPSK